MRILFICPELRDRGGNFLVSELARRLPKFDWDVTVATLVAGDDALVRAGSELLWKSINLVPIPVAGEKGTLAYIYQSIFAIREFLQNFEADVYIADGGLPPIGLRISNKHPSLVFNQGLQDCTKIDEYFASDEDRDIRSIDKILRAIGLVTNLPIVTVSEPHHQKLVSLYGDLPVTVIEPGLAPDFFTAHKVDYALSTPIVIATSGANLRDKGKGFELLTQSLNRLSGDGIEFVLRIHSTDFQSNAFDIQFPFEIIPASSAAHLAEKLSEADLYINASVYETFCLSIAEAFAVGVPSVITDSTGPRAYANAKNCICATDRSASGFYEAIKRMLSYSSEERRILGQKAAESVEQFTLENMTRRWNDYLRSLVSDRT